MGADFKVIKIDPDGSGMDYNGHLGSIVTDAKRCCNRCTIIFGTVKDKEEVGPFVLGELEPLNEDACQLLEEIKVDFPDAFPKKFESDFDAEFTEFFDLLDQTTKGLKRMRELQGRMMLQMGESSALEDFSEELFKTQKGWVSSNC